MSISIVDCWSENFLSPLFCFNCPDDLDLLTSKQVHGWATILPILGFLGLSVLNLSRRTGQMDRQTDRQTPLLNL